jgi:hypothetical protein
MILQDTYAKQHLRGWISRAVSSTLLSGTFPFDGLAAEVAVSASPCRSLPTPKSIGRVPLWLAIVGSACTSRSCEMILRFPILAARLRAVLPALSRALTISCINLINPIGLG